MYNGRKKFIDFNISHRLTVVSRHFFSDKEAKSVPKGCHIQIMLKMIASPNSETAVKLV